MTTPAVERQAAEMLRAFFEANAALPERVHDTVPRSRYDACNRDWLIEKDRADGISARAAAHIKTLEAERDAFRARLAEIEKDAARWRWARQQDWLLFSLDGPQAEQADAVVDAYMKEDALAAGKGEEKP